MNLTIDVDRKIVKKVTIELKHRAGQPVQNSQI